MNKELKAFLLALPKRKLQRWLKLFKREGYFPLMDSMSCAAFWQPDSYTRALSVIEGWLE